MTRVGARDCLQERSRGHSCWGGCGGPDERQPADGELLCSAAAATLGGGSTFHAEKLESCEKKTSPRRVVGGGGTAKRIAGGRRERKCDESGFYALYAAASVTIHVTFRNSFVLS